MVFLPSEFCVAGMLLRCRGVRGGLLHGMISAWAARVHTDLRLLTFLRSFASSAVCVFHVLPESRSETRSHNAAPNGQRPVLFDLPDGRGRLIYFILFRIFINNRRGKSETCDNRLNARTHVPPFNR